jgi:hypothetical protein
MTTTPTKHLEILTGKILSRATARGGFSTALMYEPDDKMEAQHGKLLFVIDISSPSPLSADIAYNLIDIVKEEFYSDLELSASESFENALKAANEELAAIAKQGEKDWVGKFNAIIAAIHGRNMYIVQRGTAEIHLLRGANMLNLSKGIYVPGENYRPEETLINLIEGQVEVGDKIIASTSELFYYISIEKLKRIIDSGSPAQAAKKLAEQLGNEEEINRTSVLISEFTLPELLSTEAPDKETENWIGAKEEAAPRRAQVVTPEIKLDKDESLEELAHAYRATELNPNQREELTEEEDVITESGGFDISSVIPKLSESLEPLKKIKFDKISQYTSRYTDKIQMSSPAGQKALDMTWRIIRGTGRMIGSFLQAIFVYTVDFVRAIKKRRNGNKMLLGLVIGLIVVIVGSSFGISRAYTQRVGLGKATTAFAEAQQKHDAAQAAMIYENGAKAKELLAEAYALAEVASSNSKTKEKASALAAELLTQLDTASGVKRFANVQPLANFESLNSQLGGTAEEPKSANLNRIAVVGGNIYGIDSSNNKIYKFKTLTGEYSIANSLTSTEKSLKLVTQSADNELMIYANPNAMYIFNTEQNTLTGKALDAGNWAPAEDMVVYAGRLYVLDTSSSQIHKYQTVPEGYTSIAPYFEGGSPVDLTKAIDFAIDGSVFVLMPDNVIKKFTGGSEDAFSLREVPQPYAKIGKLTAIYADADAKLLYVLDAANNRVLSFTKEGDFTGAWMYDNIKDPTQLMVDETGGFIYITAGTSTYRLPLK